MDINGRQIIVLNCEGDGSGNQVDLFTATSKANKMVKAKKSLNISDEHGDQVIFTTLISFSLTVILGANLCRQIYGNR